MAAKSVAASWDAAKTDKDTLRARFWARVDRRGDDECWAWKGSTTPRGYGQFGFAAHGPSKTKMLRAPRVAYYLATGEDPCDLLVCHHCDDPGCCNPAHLYVGTAQQNVDDMWRRKRRKTGRRHHRATRKLTERQVQQIRRYRREGMTEQAIADLIGFGRSTVQAVLRGRSWAWLPDVV